MPQVVAAMIAGAGVVAGLKWLSRALDRQIEEATRLMREMEERELRQTEAARTPRDLGTLEYDAAAQEYRPRRP